MPRYFFDFQHDGEIIADEQGQELASNDAAQGTAILIASDLVKDLWRVAPQRNLTIEVRDEQGRRILAANPFLNVIRLDGDIVLL